MNISAEDRLGMSLGIIKPKMPRTVTHNNYIFMLTDDLVKVSRKTAQAEKKKKNVRFRLAIIIIIIIFHI